MSKQMNRWDKLDGRVVCVPCREVTEQAGDRYPLKRPL